MVRLSRTDTLQHEPIRDHEGVCYFSENFGFKQWVMYLIAKRKRVRHRVIDQSRIIILMRGVAYITLTHREMSMFLPYIKSTIRICYTRSFKVINLVEFMASAVLGLGKLPQY